MPAPYPSPVRHALKTHLYASCQVLGFDECKYTPELLAKVVELTGLSEEQGVAFARNIRERFTVHDRQLELLKECVTQEVLVTSAWQLIHSDTSVCMQELTTARVTLGMLYFRGAVPQLTTEMDCDVRPAPNKHFQIKGWAAAYNPGTNEVRACFAMQGPTYARFVIRHVEALGACSVSLDGFGRGTAGLKAALGMLYRVSKERGWAIAQIGKLRFTAQPQDVPADTGTDEYAELDVVKKGRALERAEAEGIDKELLLSTDEQTHLAVFSESVLSALLAVRAEEKAILQAEHAWMQQDEEYLRGCRTGWVYAAWNSSFPDLIKIGATMRDDPEVRIRELSGTSVPTPFELVACMPSPRSFELEREVHSYYDAVRVLKRRGQTSGRTEFFMLSRDAVSSAFETWGQHKRGGDTPVVHVCQAANNDTASKRMRLELDAERSLRLRAEKRAAAGEKSNEELVAIIKSQQKTIEMLAARP